MQLPPLVVGGHIPVVPPGLASANQQPFPANVNGQDESNEHRVEKDRQAAQDRCRFQVHKREPVDTKAGKKLLTLIWYSEFAWFNKRIPICIAKYVMLRARASCELFDVADSLLVVGAAPAREMAGEY